MDRVRLTWFYRTFTALISEHTTILRCIEGLTRRFFVLQLSQAIELCDGVEPRRLLLRGLSDIGKKCAKEPKDDSLPGVNECTVAYMKSNCETRLVHVIH